MILRYAVIPTRDRPQDFTDCVTAISPQVDHIIVVSHGAPYVHDASMLGSVLSYSEDPPNISRMWNLGLDRAAELSGSQPYMVSVLNDDVVVPPDWFARVTTAMRRQGSAAGCVRRPRDPRMTGYAFILDGTKGLRADEQFRWWYGDTDLQRQAMNAGGVVYAGGPDVEHRHPNSTTVGELAVIAGQDREQFIAKWGHVV